MTRERTPVRRVDPRAEPDGAPDAPAPDLKTHASGEHPAVIANQETIARVRADCEEAMRESQRRRDRMRVLGRDTVPAR